jgi:hypothetical protein
MKAGLSDVLLISSLRLLEYFSTVLPIHLWSRIEWCAALLDSFLRLVLRVFFNSPTHSYLWKQGLSDVLPLWFLSLFGLKSIFQQSQFYL